MDIRGIRSPQSFYSLDSLKQVKHTKENASLDIESDALVKENSIQLSKELSAVSTLDTEEKQYFSETYAASTQVQTYLGSGNLKSFVPKGQVVDFKG